ncbi:hypothetical protein [Desulforamulus ruminis]|uniref:hypothetical protein n=1 Tax=Desulforamulus ruminis TaxID=1564 RepID=UPI00235270C3|nr:hypothetical protein [Desulforamulus ruminis]
MIVLCVKGNYHIPSVIGVIHSGLVAWDYLGPLTGRGRIFLQALPVDWTSHLGRTAFPPHRPVQGISPF